MIAGRDVVIKEKSQKPEVQQPEVPQPEVKNDNDKVISSSERKSQDEIPINNIPKETEEEPKEDAKEEPKPIDPLEQLNKYGYHFIHNREDDDDNIPMSSVLQQGLVKSSIDKVGIKPANFTFAPISMILRPYMNNG